MYLAANNKKNQNITIMKNENKKKFHVWLIIQLIMLLVFSKLTPVSQMEVGCSRIWGLKPTTQTQVGGTPHKPAQPAIQPWALPATSDPKSSTHHTEQWVQRKNYCGEAPPPLIGRGGRGNTRKHTNATTPNAEPSESHKDMRRRTPDMQGGRWLLKLPDDALGEHPTD